MISALDTYATHLGLFHFYDVTDWQAQNGSTHTQSCFRSLQMLIFKKQDLKLSEKLLSFFLSFKKIFYSISLDKAYDTLDCL